MRAAAFVVALVLALAQAGAAFAHATLVRAEPADGTLVAQPPAALRLTFNEPVSPLVMRLIAPDGTSTTPKASGRPFVPGLTIATYASFSGGACIAIFGDG